MKLGTDVSLADIATATSAVQKPAVSQHEFKHDFKKAANDGDSFSDCLKARSEASDEAEHASAKADAAAPEKADDDTASADDHDDDSDAAAAPQGLGLVASLLQTILAMPPKTDRGAAADVAAVSVDGTATAANTAVAMPGALAEASLAASKSDIVGTADASATQPAPIPAAQADVSSLPATHDTVPDALLAMPNGPAAAVTGTDRAAAVATPAPSQPLPHGELAEPLAERIVWMSDTARANGGNALQEARISLHPAGLGSLQIRVQLADDGSTKVSFDVQTPQARQAIEASLPQLRELLAPNLVNAATASFQLSGGLSQQQQQSSSQSQTARSAWSVQSESEVVEVQSVTSATARRRIGLLDQFA